MNHWHSHADPPRTLARRLEHLNGDLQSLHARVKDSIASAIGAAVAEAIRDFIRDLLGGKTESPPSPRPPSFEEDPRDDRYQLDDDEDQFWPEDEAFEHDRYPPAAHNRYTPRDEPKSTPWRNVLGAGVKAGLWWLCKQKSRRPVLTTSLVVLAAGVTAFLAGPALPTSIGVLASMASLVLTADTVSSFAGVLSD